MSGPTAIIVFGAAVRPDGSPSPTLRRRVEAAHGFGRQLRGALYVPTGAIGRYGPSEARVMAGLLRGLGVDGAAIRMEETATNTLSSALACARLLRHHSGPVYAASSAYHLPRCLVLLRLAGCPARACPPPQDPDLLRGWYMRAREAVALPVDVALMLVRRRINRP